MCFVFVRIPPFVVVRSLVGFSIWLVYSYVFVCVLLFAFLVFACFLERFFVYVCCRFCFVFLCFCALCFRACLVLVLLFVFRVSSLLALFACLGVLVKSSLFSLCVFRVLFACSLVVFTICVVYLFGVLVCLLLFVVLALFAFLSGCSCLCFAC